MIRWVGIDNGVSGSVAILDDEGDCQYYPTPIKNELNYTKTKQWVHRVDVVKLLEIFEPLKGGNVIILLERPMVNPGRFKATTSALRALEATLIAIEFSGLSFAYCDSKEWQKVMLPAGLEKEELKKASLDVAKRYFPNIKLKKDGDSLLIAMYAKQKFQGKASDDQKKS